MSIKFLAIYKFSVKIKGMGFLFYILHFAFTIYIPLESSFPEVVDELRVRGVSLIRYPNIRNYWVDEVPTMEGIGGWLISKIYSPTLGLDAWIDSVDIIRPTAFICYKKRPVNIVLEPVVKIGENNIWPKEKFKGAFAADYERAFVDLYNNKFSVRLGRERFGLGPSPRYNFLLSGYSPPMDGILVSYEDTKFKLSFIFSRLENMVAETLSFEGDTVHNDTANSLRFISIRRLDLLPKDWLNIGLTEVVLYGGPNGFPSLYYLNPIALSYPYEFIHKGANHNIFWAIDWRLDLPNLGGLYGEFLIDDFQYSENLQKEPNHIGLLIGAEKAFTRTFSLIEYSRATRWVYTHFVPWQRYEYFGYPIGHPLGPDFDNFFLKVTHHYSPKFDFYSVFSYTRHGSGRIESTWPVPDCPMVPGIYFPVCNFLSPPVTTYLDMRGGVNFLTPIGKFATTVIVEIGICKPSNENYLPVIKTRLGIGRL